METKELLDTALSAWEVARDKAMLEQKAFASLTQSHSELISSLRQHGHTWIQAETMFELMSDAHRDALQNAWQDMDKKCSEYRSLLTTFRAQL